MGAKKPQLTHRRDPNGAAAATGAAEAVLLKKSHSTTTTTTTTARHSDSDSQKVRPSEWLASAVILLFALIRFGTRWYTHTEQSFITTTPEQPLTTRVEDYLSPWEFKRVRECALNHPKLRVRSTLNSAGFSKTRGFVIKFNNEGVEQFQTSPEYECFASVFNGLRLPDTNAYVMNILLCELGDYDAYKADDLSVGLHLDTTVGIYSRHMFVAHQVSVLYNSVPSDMEGGELEVFEYGDGYPNTKRGPDKRVTPKENTLINFRGDAFHQVRSYRTKSGSERVALVLEQYKINDEYYPFTIRFTEAYKSNMTMM
jgi:hypothetical protein